MRRLGVGFVGIGLVAGLTSACGAKGFAPPSGPGTPFPGYAAAFEQATSDCRSVRTLTVTLGLSGRAGDQRLRGRIDAGFSAPSEVRLELRAPFGRPVFVLAARDDAHATLVLPRENRVLRDASAAAIVEALTGVSLGPAELRSAVAGCGFSAGSPVQGAAYGDWLAIDVGDATHYLMQADGRWRLLASTRGPLTIEYSDFVSGRPSTVRMRTLPEQGARTDLRLALSDVEINVSLGSEVFAVDIPAGAEPLSLEELRRAGPLGASAQ